MFELHLAHYARTGVHIDAPRGLACSPQMRREFAAAYEAPHDSHDMAGMSALHCACDHGRHEFVKALLKRGASRTLRDAELQRAPLHYAASHGHLRSVVLLVGRRDNQKMTADELSAVDQDGLTPLHIAAHKGHEAVARFLIAAGAKKDGVTKDGLNLMQIANSAVVTRGTKALSAAGWSGSQDTIPKVEKDALAAECVKWMRLIHSDALEDADQSVQPGMACAHCGAVESVSQKLRFCGGCEVARFCSPACIAAGWKAHKAACKQHQKERDEMPRTGTPRKSYFRNRGEGRAVAE